MTYLRRQVAARCVNGQVDNLPEGVVFPYRLSDVLPKYVLKLEPGLYSQDSIRLAAATSYALPLPPNYSSANRLHCTIRTNAIVKAVIVDPALGTSTHLIKSTSGTTKGVHNGVLMWQGRITSITLSVPTAFDPALIDFFLFEIPDTEDADSWRIGSQAIGVAE